MKKSTILFPLVLIVCQWKAQDIPNGNFEVWDLYNSWTLEPQYWLTQNNQIMTPVTQDTLSHEGEYAMNVHVLPGFEGGIQEIAHTSLAVEYIPVALTYWVKASVPDGYELENVAVTASFFYQGLEVYNEMDVIYDSIAEWEQHTILFDQIDVSVDEVRLLVSAGFVTALGGGSWDTWISVDEMAFSDELAVHDQNIAPGPFYPNPCAGILYLPSFEPGDTVQIIDSQGRMLNMPPASQTLDLGHLAEGLYIVRLIKSNGRICQSSIVRS